MNLGVLFSGGKDSTYATYLAQQQHTISCLLSIKPKPESEMFHTPNINITSLLAQKMNIPHIDMHVQHDELQTLYELIQQAKNRYNIQGIITGAVGSVYQATRIQKICNDLHLWCFNPLWLKPEITLLNELLEHNFTVIITGIAAYPLQQEWLGKTLNAQLINELEQLQQQYHIHPAGEGGEFETLVINCPLYRQPLVIQQANIQYNNYAGTYHITQAQ
ncbi:MAG: diphthine--ammonia ligase [Candidatus Woesearchaeota archaeon]